jgi:preprotein translocase subunit SecG
MGTVLLVIHVMIAIALVGVVLLQRSEGGALGIGGGGGGFMTGRSAGNALTRATAILGAAFFATSLLLTILNGYQTGPSILVPTKTPSTANGTLPPLPSKAALPQTPQAPASIPSAPQAPAAPEPPKAQ